MRFSIRDLLLVTVIVALAVTWWLDHRRLSLETKYLETRLIFEKARADTQKALAEYRSDLERSEATWKETREELEASRDTFGPVRGYNLLGPPLPASQTLPNESEMPHE